MTASDKLDTTERRELNNSEFGLPQQRAFPMPDAAHVRAAEAYFRYAPDTEKAELARNILLKAEQFGVTINSPIILEWAKKKKFCQKETKGFTKQNIPEIIISFQDIYFFL